ncbi:MAG: peptidoglycan-binding domain-containing protein [Candidatus Parcubacteria bacterium]|nr:peptidoglycan-binding domain-containing protein [Candidatus Parcubacteria bacterium]
MKKYLSFFILSTICGSYHFALADVQTYTVDLKMDGVDYPEPMPYGSTPTLTWTTTDISSCTASQVGSPVITGWNGGIGNSGTLKLPNLTNDTMFTITCQNPGGTATVVDSIYVRIGFYVKPSVIGISTRDYSGKIIQGSTAYVTGKGFLPTDNVLNIGNLISSPESIINASSIDDKNLSFTVPNLNPGTYSFWLKNWNGMSELQMITIVSSSTPVQTPITPVVTPALVITPIPAVVTVPVVSSLTALPCTSLTRDLKYQSRDANTAGGVSTLQSFLQKKGVLNSEPTGYFGTMTLSAVKKFQTDNLISATGFVGPLTRAKIQALSCR